MFRENINVRGGVVPVRAYISELLPDFLAGRLDAPPVLDLAIGLDQVPEGYYAMETTEDHSGVKSTPETRLIASMRKSPRLIPGMRVQIG
jgi:threonine dehydrogenase-like Zn-dependent dehydrogenase